MVLLVTLAVTALLSLAALRVRFDPDPANMLPPDSTPIKRLNELVDIFGAGDQLFLAVEDPQAHEERLEATIDRLAAKINTWRWDHPQHAITEPMIRLMVGVRRNDLDAFRLDMIGRNGFLAMPDAALPEIAQRLEPRRIAYRLENGPPSGVPAALQQRDLLGLLSYVYKEHWEAGIGGDLPLKEHNGYLRSPDRDIYVLMLKPLHAIKNTAFTHAIADALTALKEEFQADPANSGLTLHVAGGYPMASADFRAAQSSSIWMLVTSITGVVLLFGVVYRSLRLVAFIGLVCGPAIICAAGLATLVLGSTLSLIVSSFTAILVGLGVDYIIHLFNAYSWSLGHESAPHADQRERRREAAINAVHRVGNGIALGCATSVAAFAILAASDFRGMQELGVVAAIGLGAIFLLVLLMIPALLTLWGPMRCPKPRLLQSYTRRFSRQPRSFVIISLVLCCATVGVLANTPRLFQFDKDLRNLRPATSDERLQSYLALGKRLGISFGGLEMLICGQDPAVLLDEAARFNAGLADLRKPIAFRLDAAVHRAELTAGLERLPATALDAEADLTGRHILLSPWGEVVFDSYDGTAFEGLYLRTAVDTDTAPAQYTAGTQWSVDALLHATSSKADLIPAPARQRVVLAQLAELIDIPATRAALAAATADQRLHHATFFADTTAMLDRIAAQELLLPSDFDGTPLETLVRNAYTTTPDGRHWLRMPLPLRIDHGLLTFEELYAALDLHTPVGEDLAIGHDVRMSLVGGIAVAHFIQTTIVDNFVRLASIALVVTVLLLIVTMRSTAAVGITIFTLTAGVAMMFAVMHLVGIQWNIINLAVLPLLFGIGIDNAIHFIHHLSKQARSHDSLGRTLIEIGHPVMMTALTSIVGFGALLTNAYRGIQGFGLLACVGIVTCLVATLLFLPAILVCTHYRPPPDPEQDPRSRVLPAIDPEHPPEEE